MKWFMISYVFCAVVAPLPPFEHHGTSCSVLLAAHWRVPLFPIGWFPFGVVDWVIQTPTELGTGGW